MQYFVSVQPQGRLWHCSSLSPGFCRAKAGNNLFAWHLWLKGHEQGQIPHEIQSADNPNLNHPPVRSSVRLSKFDKRDSRCFDPTLRFSKGIIHVGTIQAHVVSTSGSQRATFYDLGTRFVDLPIGSAEEDSWRLGTEYVLFHTSHHNNPYPKTLSAGWATNGQKTTEEMPKNVG